MKIAFLTPSISRAIGGIFEIERRLGQSLATIPGVEISVYGLQDEHTVADLARWRPLVPRYYPVSGPQAFGYSAQLKEAFLQENAEVAHLHSLWMFTSVILRRWGQTKRRPYMVTPNGMLEPWALKNSAWKKRVAGLLYENCMLEGAACLQANTEKEAADIRAYGLTNPICIIPNGIDLPEVGSQKSEIRSQTSDLWPLVSGRKVLLYLGRIHPKKGLVNLLRAWSAVNRKSEIGNRKSEEWVLAIAGWDQGGHEAELKRLATELGIIWAESQAQGASPLPHRGRGQGEGALRQIEVHGEVSNLSSGFRSSPTALGASRPISLLFTGPQFGPDKESAYRNCDAFILPSFSEGLPMVVLEAWAYGKPVLMTPECNLPEGYAANAAIRIEPNTGSIAQGLTELFRLPSSDLCSLGNNGRALVASRFTWPKIAADMKSVYDWVLGGGPKTGCVV